MSTQRSLPIPARLLVVAAAATAAIAVAGCAPVVPAPAGSAVAGSTTKPSPTATATPTPTIDPNILFTLSATATATGSNGAIVDLAETVYAPAATTSDLTADIAALNKQCAGWQRNYPNPVFLVATSTATVRAGSPAWPATITPVAVSIDGAAPTAWAGDYSPFEAECASPLVNIPGQVRGIEPLAVGATPDSKTGWAGSRYGFGAATDVPDTQIPKKDRITINNCKITLGAAAKADPTASEWATAINSQKFPNEACFVGLGD